MQVQSTGSECCVPWQPALPFTQSWSCSPDWSCLLHSPEETGVSKGAEAKLWTLHHALFQRNERFEFKLELRWNTFTQLFAAVVMGVFVMQQRDWSGYQNVEPCPFPRRGRLDSPKDLLCFTVSALSMWKRKRMKGAWVEVHGYKHWTYHLLVIGHLWLCLLDKVPLQEHQVVEPAARRISHFTSLLYW